MSHYECDYCGQSFCQCEWSRFEGEFRRARSDISKQVQEMYMKRVEPMMDKAKRYAERLITIRNIYKVALKDDMKLSYELMHYGGLRLYAFLKGRQVEIDEFKDNMQ